MRALPFVRFCLRCACLLLCANAGASAASPQVLRGRWVGYGDLSIQSLEFRAGDTVWLLIPIAAILENGRGTYEYAQSRLLMHYGEGLTLYCRCLRMVGSRLGRGFAQCGGQSLPSRPHGWGLVRTTIAD